MKYELTGKNANSMIIVQHLDSGDYDYSENDTVEAAAETALSEWWNEGHELSREEALQQCLDSMECYWLHEALEAAKDGHDWPIKLGFVEAIEDEEDEEDEED